MIGKGNKTERTPVIIHVERSPAAILGLHVEQPLNGAVLARLLLFRTRRIGAVQRQQHHRGVVDVGIKLIGEFEIPAGRLGLRALHGPVTLAADFLGQQPVGGSAQRVVRRFHGFTQGEGCDARVPHHREAGLEEETRIALYGIVHHEIVELALRVHALRTVWRISQQIQRHDDVHHGRINRGHSVGVPGVLQHPLFSLADGALPQRLGAVFFPDLQNFVEMQKDIAPGETGTVEAKLQLLSIHHEKFFAG